MTLHFKIMSKPNGSAPLGDPVLIYTEEDPQVQQPPPVPPAPPAPQKAKKVPQKAKKGKVQQKAKKAEVPQKAKNGKVQEKAKKAEVPQKAKKEVIYISDGEEEEESTQVSLTTSEDEEEQENHGFQGGRARTENEPPPNAGKYVPLIQEGQEESTQEEEEEKQEEKHEEKEEKQEEKPEEREEKHEDSQKIPAQEEQKQANNEEIEASPIQQIQESQIPDQRPTSPVQPMVPPDTRPSYIDYHADEEKQEIRPERQEYPKPEAQDEETQEEEDQYQNVPWDGIFQQPKINIFYKNHVHEVPHQVFMKHYPIRPDEPADELNFPVSELIKHNTELGNDLAKSEEARREAEKKFKEKDDEFKKQQVEWRKVLAAEAKEHEDLWEEREKFKNEKSKAWTEKERLEEEMAQVTAYRDKLEGEIKEIREERDKLKKELQEIQDKKKKLEMSGQTEVFEYYEMKKQEEITKKDIKNCSNAISRRENQASHIESDCGVSDKDIRQLRRAADVVRTAFEQHMKNIDKETEGMRKLLAQFADYFEKRTKGKDQK